MSVAGEDIVSCFGVKRNCGKDCDWKEECRKKYQEESEDDRLRRYEHEEYTDEMDETGAHTLLDRPEANTPPEECGDSDRFEWMDRLIDRMELPVDDLKVIKKLLRARKIYEDGRLQTLKFVRRMGELWAFDRISFEVIFFQVLTGGSQAQFARMAGCSKQNISKMRKNGRKRMENYLREIPVRDGARLTNMECAVYRALVLENFTYREAASACGVSLAKIQRVIHSLRIKGVKMIQKRRGRRRKKRIEKQ